jgi:hypothetical protein
MALFKQIPLHGERYHLQFRAEVYDVFNHTNFKNLTNQSFSGSSGDLGTKAQFQVDSLGHFAQSNPAFGQYQDADLKRRMQLALKFIF